VFAQRKRFCPPYELLQSHSLVPTEQMAALRGVAEKVAVYQIP
jgi:hypothetical protein